MWRALLIGLFAALGFAIDESAFAPADCIEKDVAIIGGGASGTYAAVRLREDLNKSIVVIERDDHLGGHVNTYHDPASNTDIDYGVLAYIRYGNSAAFFERFDIPITPYVSVPQTTVYANSVDASLLSSYMPPSFPDQLAAIQKWVNLTAPYTDRLLPALWDFWAPEDIPEELLMPFGEFAERYDLEAMAPLLAVIANVGVGGIKEVLTLYVYFAFGQPVAQGFLDGSFFQPMGYSNSELYRRALQLLKDDVMLQNHVVAAERNDDGVKIVTCGADGKEKLIKAKKLLFTPPPSLGNLAPFDLDAKETAPYSTWTGAYTLAAVARIPDIPENTTVLFTAPDAAPSNTLNIRDWPYSLSLASAAIPGEDLFEILLSTNYSISHEDGQKLIMDAVQNLTTTHAVSNSTDSTVEFREVVDHNSVLWRQSPEQLKAGIVQDVYSLQGYRSTYYGASLLAQDYTGNVWAFVDTILPRMLSDL
ncbi:MAG: hypothetical protein Q9162_001330 [Coniocarpon cinnabarinum]